MKKLDLPGDAWWEYEVFETRPAAWAFFDECKTKTQADLPRHVDEDCQVHRDSPVIPAGSWVVFFRSPRVSGENSP